ncbi:MAG: transporter [Verrucomicrobiales bacterium]|nr:transporter [Verrucomicrobiales bacterium]
MADGEPQSILSASDIVLKYGHQTILEGAGMAIHEGDHVGMVGRNGSGKSSFLKILAGTLSPDSGEVIKRRDLVVGYLSQDFTLNEEKTVVENIMEGASFVLGLISQFEGLPGDASRAHDLEHRINTLEGWTVDSRVKAAMSHLNVPDGDRKIDNLSGGEKRRVAMAKVLVSRPDLLLLDEPTNHLDPEAIEWVTDFLLGFNGAFLTVTHDRYFLDRITSRIVEVSGGKTYTYQGNYTDYLLEKAERNATAAKNEQSRQGFLRKELEWVRRGPKARTTKSKSRLDRYFEVAGQSGPEEDMDVDLVIPRAGQMGNRGVDLEDVGLELGGRWLLRNLTLKCEPGTKIGIAGKNGLGKSSLLKIIIGEIKPTEGTVRTGELVKFNYVDQSRLFLDESKTVFDELSQGSEVVNLGEEKISIRSYLKRFLFTDERINTQVKYLSGGEKSRLLLARILKSGGNFLILDEPTNDLDLPTLRILEQALDAFEGSLLVVSHDRYFLNRVCNGILAFEGEGNVTYSSGN